MSPGEFSFVIAVESAPVEGRTVRLEAPPTALPAIAARLGVPAVKSLSGTFDVRRTSDGLSLHGEIDATLIRECVASLEPFEERVVERFDLRFDRSAPRGAELELDEDSPEPLEGEAIDLAEILVQQLSLAMDPWPRKPGAKPVGGEFGPSEQPSPFVGLDRLIAKKGDQG